MLHALALGADWVWCADDDGRPADDDVLATLLDCAQRPRAGRGLPAGDRHGRPRRGWPSRCAAGCAGGGGAATSPDVDVLPGYASLFNGALFRADALDVGRRAGLPAVLPRRRDRDAPPAGPFRAAVRHLPRARRTCTPRGPTEFQPILGGRLSAQYPPNEVKRFFTYRNRGYLMAQPGMRWLLPLEWIRFSWFFLVHRRDPAGWRSGCG